MSGHLEQKTPNEDGNGKKFSQAWKTLLGLAVMALFLWLAFRRIPLGDFLKTLKEASLLPVAAVFLWLALRTYEVARTNAVDV